MKSSPLDAVIELGKQQGYLVERIGDDEPAFLEVHEDTELRAVWQVAGGDLDILLALYRRGAGPWCIVMRLASPCPNPACGDRHKTGARISMKDCDGDAHEGMADALARAYQNIIPTCDEPQCDVCGRIHKNRIDATGEEAGVKLLSALKGAEARTLH